MEREEGTWDHYRDAVCPLSEGLALFGLLVGWGDSHAEIIHSGKMQAAVIT